MLKFYKMIGQSPLYLNGMGNTFHKPPPNLIMSHEV